MAGMVHQRGEPSLLGSDQNENLMARWLVRPSSVAAYQGEGAFDDEHADSRTADSRTTDSGTTTDAKARPKAKTEARYAATRQTAVGWPAKRRRLKAS
jgi:hypothetical protein